MSGRKILIFEKSTRRAAELRELAQAAGAEARAAFYPAEAVVAAGRDTFALLVAGFDLLPLPPELMRLPLVVTAPEGNMERVEGIFRRYAIKAPVITYPFGAEAAARLAAALAGEKERGAAIVTKDIPFIIGKAPKTCAMKNLLLRAAAVNSPVLLLGESGTGKELAARALHEMGPRAKGPFVAVNCGAIPEPLVESELFGHERGSFTGAVGRRAGKFEAADRGTLFLDEIGDLPLAMQVKLLRALEGGVFHRVGGERPVKVDVRTVCATNRDVFEMANRGEFRRDLLYRINVLAIPLPPLRERVEDIPELAEHLLGKLTAGAGPSGFSPSAMQTLLSARWPGNVRQLENVIARAVVKCRGKRIEEISADGEPAPTPAPPDLDALMALDHATMKERVLDYYEERYLRALMERAGGAILKVSAVSGMDRKTLYRKLKQFGLDKKDFK